MSPTPVWAGTDSSPRTSFLFLGGPIDGQWRTLSARISGRPVQVAVDPQRRVLYHPNRIGSSPDRVFTVYAPGDWDGARIIATLIHGYRRSS